MKINDRGTMKWVSLMLPEQIEGLRRLQEEQNRKEKSILDEQKIEENSFKLRGALQYKLELKITYFANHDFKSIEGSIQNINNKIIYINDDELNFDDIIEVDFVNSIFVPF